MSGPPDSEGHWFEIALIVAAVIAIGAVVLVLWLLGVA